MCKIWLGLAAVLATAPALAEVNRSVANDGKLVMEDVPPIPAEIVNDLNRYQNVRSAAFRGWTGDGRGIFVATRFGDVAVTEQALR